MLSNSTRSSELSPRSESRLASSRKPATDRPVTRAINSASGRVRAILRMAARATAPGPPPESRFAAASACWCEENPPAATRSTCAFADTPPAIDSPAAPTSCSRICSSRAAQNHHRARLRIPAALNSDHHAIFHFRLPAQRRLQILGIHIRPARGDDHFLLASLEIKIAGLIERADVAGAIPALVI